MCNKLLICVTKLKSGKISSTLTGGALKLDSHALTKRLYTRLRLCPVLPIKAAFIRCSFDKLYDLKKILSNKRSCGKATIWHEWVGSIGVIQLNQQ